MQRSHWLSFEHEPNIVPLLERGWNLLTPVVSEVPENVESLRSTSRIRELERRLKAEQRRAHKRCLSARDSLKRAAWTGPALFHARKSNSKTDVAGSPMHTIRGFSYSYFSCSRSWKAFIFAWRLLFEPRSERTSLFETGRDDSIKVYQDSYGGPFTCDEWTSGALVVTIPAFSVPSASASPLSSYTIARRLSSRSADLIRRIKSPCDSRMALLNRLRHVDVVSGKAPGFVVVGFPDDEFSQPGGLWANPAASYPV